MRSLLVLLIFVLSAWASKAQEGATPDSLKLLISQTSDRAEKIDLLIDLGEYYSLNKEDSLYRIATEIIELAEAENDPCSKATGVHYKANYFYANSELQEALQLYTLSLEIRRAHCLEQRVASSLIMIGNMHSLMGEYEAAYDAYYKSLDLYKSISDNGGISFVYSNLGLLDVQRGEYEQGKKNYTKALEFEGSSKERDSINLGNIYNNFGGMYEAQEKYDTAIFYFKIAMDIYQATGHKSGLSHGYTNLGIVFYYNDYPDSCMSYFKKSLDIRKELGSKVAISQSYNNIGILYMYDEKYSTALIYADSALNLAVEGGYKEEISDAYASKYEIYFEWGEYYDAAINLKLWSDYKDTLASEQSERAINFMNTKYETVKTEQKLQAKEVALEKQEASNKRKNLILGAAFLVAVLLGGLALVIFNRNKVTKKQNQIIAEQKVIVEEKQNEMLDSIRYAKRIQDALLKTEDHVSSHLPEHFVFYQPKDIVSGDFYWVHEQENYLYIAAADCTGHGVPGGFLTMLGCSFLNEIVSGDRELQPAEILEELRKRMVKELSQSGEGENRDGMDISLVRYNLRNKKMTWSGANNPIWILRESKAELPEEKKGLYVYKNLIEYRPDKQPIGHHWVMKPFTNHEVSLFEGDSFYLFTDGYADQFGGDRGKKFKYKPLKDLIIETKGMAMQNRKARLEQEFFDWMGSYEQIDDVCVIGVRV